MKNNKFAYLLGMVGLAILTMIILWIQQLSVLWI